MQAAVTGVNWRRVWMIAAIVLLCVLAILLARRIPKTMAVFVIAGFLASAIHPLACRLEERRIPRAWAIMIVYAIVIMLVVICVIVVLPLTIAQTQVLLGNVPIYLQLAQTWLGDARDALVRHFPMVNLPPQFFDVQHLGADRVGGIVTTTLASVGALALNVATALFIALSSLILSFFMLLNYRQLADGFAAFFPTRRRHTALRLASQTVHLFGSYIAGQVIVSAIVGLLIAGGTALLGFKFALLLGLVSAIAYAIPILGMLAAHALGLVIAAPFGWVMILKVEIWMFIIARVGDNVLVPKIMGKSVGVSPIGVMFAVFAGGELFGLPGLILGIPAAALIKLVWGYFIGPWLHAQVEIADLTAPPPAPEELTEINVISVET